jgi:hypothetical protein
MGRQDELLERHQARLDKLNGSLADVAIAMTKFTLEIQQLRSDFTSAAATVVATATALEKAQIQARQTADDKAKAADKRWSPWAKTFVVIGAVVGVVALAAMIWGLPS